jgi:hypothetical protein
MPRDNETGPSSMDPITGMGAGCCNSGQSRNRAINSTGKGAGDHVRCGWFNAADLAGRTPQENEEKLLRDEADTLRKQLDEVGRRLNEL